MTPDAWKALQDRYSLQALDDAGSLGRWCLLERVSVDVTTGAPAVAVHAVVAGPMTHAEAMDALQAARLLDTLRRRADVRE